MHFGDALKELEAGQRIARAVWNGRGMWLTLLRAGEEIPKLYENPYSGELHDMASCIGMMTAQGTMQPGWLASQADVLSVDWEIV